jgi:hypothetical protein
MEAEQFKQLVESAGDAVVIADREGVIRFWNAAAEFGGEDVLRPETRAELDQTIEDLTGC